MGSRSDFLTVRNEIPQGDSKGNEAGTLRASRPAALPVSGTRFLNKVGRVRAREGRGLTCAPEARKAHKPQGRPFPDLGHPSPASCTLLVPILAQCRALGISICFHSCSNPASPLFTHKERTLCWVHLLSAFHYHVHVKLAQDGSSWRSRAAGPSSEPDSSECECEASNHCGRGS